MDVTDVTEEELIGKETVDIMWNLADEKLASVEIYED